jgi:hypothetical protein
MLPRRLLLPLLIAVSAPIQALSATAQDKPIATTICEVAKDPAAFDNKFVRG